MKFKQNGGKIILSIKIFYFDRLILLICLIVKIPSLVFIRIPTTIKMSQPNRYLFFISYNIYKFKPHMEYLALM